MKTNIAIVLLVICAIIAVGLLVIDLIKRNTEHELSDDSVEFLNECVQNSLNNLISIVARTWNIDPDEMRITSSNIDFMTQLVYVEANGFCVRLYCYWSQNKIKCEYLYDLDNKTIGKSKRFRIEHNIIDLKKFECFIEKQFEAAKHRMAPKNDHEMVTDLANVALSLAKDEKMKDEDFRDILLKVWDELPLRKRKKFFENDNNNFVRLTAYLMRYYPKEFISFLKVRIGEDKVENKD